MSVITLSRQLGCHGEEIAAEVAEALGLRLIDAATISRAAEKAGVPQVAVAELENEGARSLADQVLTALRTMPSLYTASAQLGSSTGKEGIGYPGASGLTIPFTGLFSPTVSPISASLQSYVYMVSMVIRGLAREGNVLIVGRGGQVLLRKHRRAMHVQVVAPMGNRIEELMEREDLERRAAQSRLRASDRARFDYIRRYHGVNWLDSTLYHLVINTGRFDVPQAVDLIVAAQRRLAHADGHEAARA